MASNVTASESLHGSPSPASCAGPALPPSPTPPVLVIPPVSVVPPVPADPPDPVDPPLPADPSTLVLLDTRSDRPPQFIAKRARHPIPSRRRRRIACQDVRQPRVVSTCWHVAWYPTGTSRARIQRERDRSLRFLNHCRSSPWKSAVASRARAGKRMTCGRNGSCNSGGTCRNFVNTVRRPACLGCLSFFWPLHAEGKIQRCGAAGKMAGHFRTVLLSGAPPTAPMPPVPLSTLALTVLRRSRVPLAPATKSHAPRAARISGLARTASGSGGSLVVSRPALRAENRCARRSVHTARSPPTVAARPSTRARPCRPRARLPDAPRVPVSPKLGSPSPRARPIRAAVSGR
jgi:hypothetical protein